MSIERAVLAFVGGFILVRLIFSRIFSPYWLFFTAFVGFNLLQSAFTGFCLLSKILKAVGEKPDSPTSFFQCIIRRGACSVPCSSLAREVIMAK